MSEMMKYQRELDEARIAMIFPLIWSVHQLPYWKASTRRASNRVDKFVYETHMGKHDHEAIRLAYVKECGRLWP